MDQIKIDAEEAVADVLQVLGKNGRLSRAIPGFVARNLQIELSSNIAKAIAKQTVLIAEAGTGTGKTFAYLIPCLLSGKRAIISTATKTLQDQLFYKDLPMLVRALGLSVRIQNLKGRANYLCRHRIALYREESRFTNAQAAHDLIYVTEKLPQLKDGERSELPEISEDSQIWPYVTSTVDNCLGYECPQYKECFLTKARKRALDADVVVINHHLFFADSRLKEEGFGELLPGVDVVVFDEAHQLADIAENFNGERMSSRQLSDLIEDLIKEWPVLDLPNQPLKQLSFEADALIEKLLLAIPAEVGRLSYNDLLRNKAFQEAWLGISTIIDSVKLCIEKAGLSQEGINRCKKRLETLQSFIQNFNQVDNKFIRWLERFKQSILFYATPFHIADAFKALLERFKCAYIFTSATLTMASSFDCFVKPLGLERADTLLLPSPFDYQQQVLLYMPRNLPDPKEGNYHACLVEKALPIIEACQGRCFFLFTSHWALKLVAGLLRNTLNYPLLIQGEEAKPILLARFRQLGNAVLLGTATFWEGVDVKGEALSCVIIDKLPFASPVDPIIQGKMAYFKSQGLSGFDELTLPAAVLALKQGVGRLIRDEGDKGVLMIADPRLSGREYGRQIFKSLPALCKTREEQSVLKFIKQLALKDEIISH